MSIGLDCPAQLIGIGASAARIEAFRSFFESMPADPGIAFVIVLKDEMLFSLLIEDLLAEYSGVVVGPFGRVSSALEAARTEMTDLAVLDVNVAGTKVYPVAEVLYARGTPFVLVSGYGRSAVPEQLNTRARA